MRNHMAVRRSFAALRVAHMLLIIAIPEVALVEGSTVAFLHPSDGAVLDIFR